MVFVLSSVDRSDLGSGGVFLYRGAGIPSSLCEKKKIFDFSFFFFKLFYFIFEAGFNCFTIAVHQAGLHFTEICLSLPLKCWD